MKVVIVLDRNLPVGLLANAAAVLAFSSAPHLPGSIGPDVEDADGGVHPGITNLPIPVLACESECLRELRAKAAGLPGVGCVDFSSVAQRSKRYEEYAGLLGSTRSQDLAYLGLCLYGPATELKRLTGHLALVK